MALINFRELFYINFQINRLVERLRFNDLETNALSMTPKDKKKSSIKKLPGTDKAQDFGAAPAYTTNNLPENQETQSIESAATVITEDAEKASSTKRGGELRAPQPRFCQPLCCIFPCLLTFRRSRS